MLGRWNISLVLPGLIVGNGRGGRMFRRQCQIGQKNRGKAIDEQSHESPENIGNVREGIFWLSLLRFTFAKKNIEEFFSLDSQIIDSFCWWGTRLVVKARSDLRKMDALHSKIDNLELTTFYACLKIGQSYCVLRGLCERALKWRHKVVTFPWEVFLYFTNKKSFTSAQWISLA